MARSAANIARIYSADQVTENPVVELALTWLQRDPVPRLIVTSGRKLLWLNEAAQGHLKGGCGLVRQGPLLTAADSISAAAFEAFLAAPADEAPIHFHMLLLDGSGHLVATRSPLSDSGGGETLLGLSLTVTGGDARHHYADIDRAFGLTRRENHVLQEMLNGASAQDIASAMRVSLETVRSHIRGIYGKLRVQTREQLFSRAQPFRV